MEHINELHDDIIGSIFSFCIFSFSVVKIYEIDINMHKYL